METEVLAEVFKYLGYFRFPCNFVALNSVNSIKFYILLYICHIAKYIVYSINHFLKTVTAAKHSFTEALLSGTYPLSHKDLIICSW